jgi:hypothetical protein
MPIVRHVDLPLLYQLWNDHTLTRVRISEMLRISPTHLTRLVARHKLPPRPRDKNQHGNDPTPDEIAQRAAECRERHFAQRRAEPDCSTTSKVSKWRAGICQPSGGRHA